MEVTSLNPLIRWWKMNKFIDEKDLAAEICIMDKEIEYLKASVLAWESLTKEYKHLVVEYKNILSSFTTSFSERP